jgi:ComF family protein
MVGSDLSKGANMNSALITNVSSTAGAQKNHARSSPRMRRLVRAGKKFILDLKYLVVQERCRLCERLIHPLVEYQDHSTYARPGQYLFRDQILNSEVICHSCCRELRFAEALWTNLFMNKSETAICNVPIFSGTVFNHTSKRLIHKFKYDRDTLLRADLSIYACHAWQLLLKITGYRDWGNRDRLDRIGPNTPVLVPVPLHWRRRRHRGFNQSQLLAQSLAKLAGLSVSPNALCRVRNTASQQELTREERAKNIQGAFEASAELVGERTIILLDDVCTTGATLLECAKTLTAAGASRVYALTLARVQLVRQVDGG